MSKKTKKNNKKNIIGIIPARMSSSRFPGKPMAMISGIPMIGHCYLRSVMSTKLTDCYVATPDKEIFDYITKILKGNAVMTSHKHKMCHDRVVEAITKIEYKKKMKYDIIVNIQGDLPLVYPDMIDQVIQPILKNKNIQTTTMKDEIKNMKDFYNPNRVKIITDIHDNLILATREAVPSNRKFKGKYKKYKHVALRGFDRKIFKKAGKLKMTPIEKIEAIDELRLLENGIKINVAFTKKITDTVDTLEDLHRVQKLMKKDSLIKFYKNTL